MRVLILGAGGHGQVVADILRCMQLSGACLAPVGFLDDDPHLHGRVLLGLPVLGGCERLTSFPHDASVVALGDNVRRAQLFRRTHGGGETFLVVRHPQSTIAADVEIGSGTMICAGVVVNPGTRIGNNVILNTGCTIDHHNVIGDHAHVAPGVHTGGEVRIGEGTLVGIGATVMPGCSVGSWSVIGAGAVVTADLPGSVTAVGVPARILRRLNSRE